MLGKIVVLCVVLVYAVSIGEAFDPNYWYGANQNHGNSGQIHALEQELNEMKAKEEIMETRQSAISNSFKDALTQLSLDSKTVKTAVNVLSEDMVKMHGDIQLLKGHSAAMINLGRKMMDLEKKMGRIQELLSDRM